MKYQKMAITLISGVVLTSLMMTANGQQPTGTETQQFQQWGVSFSHPASLTVRTSTGKTGLVKDILLLGQDGTVFRIRLFPSEGITVDDLAQATTDGFLKGTRNTKADAKISETKSQRNFFGAPRVGRKYTDDSQGAVRTTEFYFFQFGSDLVEGTIQFFDKTMKASEEVINNILKTAKKK